MAESGRNNRRMLEAYDSVHGRTLSVDSVEEVDALNFLCEAVQLSAIDDFSYQPCSFQLSEGVDYVDVAGRKRCLFRDHVYSPDFCVVLAPGRHVGLSKEFKLRQSDLSSPQVSVYVDVKGAFAGHDGGRSFSLNQKWTWQKFGVYVYKLVPKAFFGKFGVPRLSFLSRKTGRARKVFAGMRSVAQSLFPDGRG